MSSSRFQSGMSHRFALAGPAPCKLATGPALLRGLLAALNALGLGRFPGADLDPARPHLLRHLKHQRDVEQAILQARVRYLYVVGQLEPAFERPSGYAAMEVVTIVLIRLVPAHHQHIGLVRDRELAFGEPRHR